MIHFLDKVHHSIAGLTSDRMVRSAQHMKIVKSFGFAISGTKIKKLINLPRHCGKLIGDYSER
ncbi:hypothetical protein UB48_03305 [Pseudomonas sp. 2(2015)]|nr:hypothetical protein UB48_03305 [Pseudomonas sp. 2(2015)]